MARTLAMARWALCTMAMTLAPLALRAATPHRVANGSATLYASGIRGVQTAASSKLDGVLAELSRHAALARPEHLMANLHALSPAARFRAAGPNRHRWWRSMP